MISDRVITLVPQGKRKSLWSNGDQVTCKAVSEDKLGAYSLFEVTVAPQASPSAHIHQWEGEAYYILEGELLIQQEDLTFMATAGSCVNIPKGILHTFKNVGTVTAKMLVVITPAWYGKFFEEWVSSDRSSIRCNLSLLRKTWRKVDGV